MLKYAAHHYDENLRLKDPFTLWLCFLYGIRHFFIIVVAAKVSLVFADNPWLDLQSSSFFLANDVLALVVFMAIGHRVPNASQLMRWVWLHGRWLLAGAYLLGIGIFVKLHQSILSHIDHPQFLTALSVLLIDLLIVTYLLKSELIKDIFNEFPEPQSASQALLTDKNKPVSALRQMQQELDVSRRIKLLSEAIMQGITVSSVHHSIEQMLQQAANYESNNQMANAETMYRQVLNLQMDSAPAWHALGLLAFEVGKREHAVALVNEALRIEPQAGIYQRNLCEMYRRMGRLEEAIKHGEIACQLNPNDIEAGLYFGLALTNDKRFSQAEQAYRQVLALNPKHLKCWNNLGVVLQLMKSYEEAEVAYRCALTLNQNDRDALRNIQSLYDEINATHHKMK